jgi:two-component system, NarL family, nitrate/nitrite response regulator NarL
MRLLLIDDHCVVIDAVAKSIEAYGDFRCTVAYTIDSGLRSLENDERPEAIILDIRMPGESGTSGIEKVLAAADGIPVILFSGNSNDANISEGLALGAQGFIPKTLSVGATINAIQLILDGYQFVPANFALKVNTLNRGVASLTENDRVMLKEFASGKSLKELSDDFGFSLAKTKNMSRLLYRKLGTINRAEAVMKGKELKLI